MPNYRKAANGCVYHRLGDGFSLDDTPVIVIPEADWAEMVASVRACGGLGAAPVDRIWEIIFRTEEANDG